MMYKKIEDYKDQSFKNPYPSDNIDPALKRDKNYFLAFNNALLADYASNRCVVPYTTGAGKRSFDELDLYATGQQPSSKIKDSLIGSKRKTTDGRYKTTYNISWDNMPVLAKMFDVIRGKNMQIEYEPVANCIDDDSLAAKEAERETMKFLVDKNTRELFERMGYKGQEVNPEQIGILNAQDVDMYFDTGGYTMQRETACIAACQKTKLSSKYKVIQDSTFDDLFKYSITGWKSYIERSTNIPKIRKVNIKKAIIPHSEDNDFQGITRAAEIRTMTIADIRKENPELTGAELLYIAKCFSWLNPGYQNLMGPSGYYSNSSRYDQTNKYNTDPVNRCLVQVLDSQWLSIDTDTYVKNTNRERDFFQDRPYGYKIDEKHQKKGDKLVQKNVVRKFESQWIIGTDMFLSYGVSKDVVYYGPDGNKTPKLDFFFTKTGNSSHIERCISIVDDLDLANAKLRQALTSIPPAPRMWIQKDLLENVFLNGIKQQPEDIIHAYQERGVGFMNMLDDNGNPIYQAGTKLIDFQTGGIGEDVVLFGNRIADCVNRIREVLGIPQGADGSTPNPYQGLGKTQLAQQSSDATLFPVTQCYSYLFTNTFDDIIKKWQIVVKNSGSMKVAYSPLGIKNMKVIELGGDFTNADFNIEIEMSAGVEEKMALLQDIAGQKAIGTQTGGKQGLTTSEYMYVYDKVMSGNMREAYFVMGRIEAKKAAAQRQAEIENQQITFKGQQDSANTKATADAQQIKDKGLQEMLLEMMKGMNEQNRAIVQALYKTNGEQPVNAQMAMQNLEQNTQQQAAIIAANAPQPQPAPEEEMAE